MRWTVSVPVWGRAYARMFAECAAPALLASLRLLRGGEAVRFVAHTTREDEPAVRAALAGARVETRLMSPRPTYVALQQAHAEVVAEAPPGDCVVLLNADLVVSGNFFVRCAEHLGEGARAVVLLGIRTAAGRELPPAGVEPRDLLRWAWGHRHQIIRDLEYPRGPSLLPTNLFFSDERQTVVARGFHLHPAAIVKGEDTVFKSTIDGDLLDCFPRETVHVVTDPDDLSMLEVSRPDRRFPVRAGATMTAASVALSMRHRASATHRWLATHRIGVVGPTVDCGDEAFIREVLDYMSRPTPRADELRRQRGQEPGGRRGTPPREN